MKSSTKKPLMAVVIILIFGLSSIAFFATGLVGHVGRPQQQFKPLQSFLIEGEADFLTENTYIQNGYTWIKFYYKEPDPEEFAIFDSLPTSFPVSQGQPQIVVQKLNQQYLNETKYIIITSVLGQESFSDVNFDKIFASLCRLLIVTPVECGFGAFINATNSTA